MSKEPRVIRDRASTLRNTPAVTPNQVEQGLIVIVNGVVSTHSLPPSGIVTLGRARESDIQIIDPSVSRMHARVRLGSPVTIEDLGSANGTRVRGAVLSEGQAVELPAGESVELGGAIVMLQRRSMLTREWRIWAHGYFEARLEEECARATRSGGHFALLRVKVGEDSRSEVVVQQVIANTLRADDVVGIYGPGDYEALLVERSEAEAERVSQSLEGAFADVELPVTIATALFPRDGRTADRLVAKAGSELRGESAERDAGKLVVRSPAMRRLHELAARVAPGDISILVLGDTGVGKEVMAEELHKLSPRRDKAFLRLNCAALSESLLESELFGHERGAFTGAHQAKAGLLETAQGGTIFLDEIGELPMTMQVKLLRVLEERQVWRVGGVKPRAIDVRFIAATNRNLDEAVATARFRQDLFFRLNGVSLLIPPLRERVEEIEDLAHEFIELISKQLGRANPPTLGSGVLELMLDYSWPGNIRELRNAIERAVLLAGDGPIQREHFPVEKMTATVSTPLAQPASDRPNGTEVGKPTLVPPSGELGEAGSLGDLLRRQVKDVEREHILNALKRCGGNQTRAAKELGISRRTLISRLEEYKIARPLKSPRAD